MTLAQTNTDKNQTVLIQIRLPVELSIEINKLRAETRTNNATVIADLIRSGLAARTGPQPPSRPTTPKAKATPGRPVTTQPKANKQTPGPQVLVDPSKWTKNLADIPALTLADLQERERQRQLSLSKPVAPSEESTQPEGLAVPAAPVVADVTVADTVRVDDEAMVRHPAYEDLEAFFGQGETQGPKPAVKGDTRTDAEKGFTFLDPNAPLDLSILSEEVEEEDPNPFAGFTPPAI